VLLTEVDWILGRAQSLTLWRPTTFGDFQVRTTGSHVVCACVTWAPKVVESCSKAQKTWQVF